MSIFTRIDLDIQSNIDRRRVAKAKHFVALFPFEVYPGESNTASSAALVLDALSVTAS